MKIFLAHEWLVFKKYGVQRRGADYVDFVFVTYPAERF